MSKGLSKLQRQIVGLLDGSIKRQVYSSGPLTTAELLEELIASGVMADDRDRKLAMFTIRRACHSLLNRGIIAGEYIHDCDNAGRIAAKWYVEPASKS